MRKERQEKKRREIGKKGKGKVDKVREVEKEMEREKKRYNKLFDAILHSCTKSLTCIMVTVGSILGGRGR